MKKIAALFILIFFLVFSAANILANADGDILTPDDDISSTESTVYGDQSSDGTSSDGTSSDGTSSNDTSSDDTSSADTSSDDTSSDDTSSDDTSSDDTSSDDTSSDDTSSDDTSSDPDPDLDPDPEPEPDEDDTPFSYSDGFLYGLADKTKASTFCALLGDACGGIFDADGNSLSGDESSYVGTGYSAIVGKNTYTVVVMGDVTGDGQITAPDHLLAKRHVLGGQTDFSEAALHAASIDRSGSPTAVDCLKIKKYILNGLFDLINNRPIECPHEVCTEATCTSPAKCIRCGEAVSPALGHDLIPATCIEPMTCKRCGMTKGSPAGHKYMPATLERPMTCSVCGETIGKPLEAGTLNAAIRLDKGSTEDNGKINLGNTNYTIPGSLLEKLNRKIEQADGNLAFYVVDINTQATIGYNIDREINSACVVKAAYCLYAAMQIDAGNGSLDELMEFQPKHYYPKSGTIKNSPFGTKFTLREILYRTIHISDNCGYYMLVDRFGRDGYNEWLDSLGVKYLHLTRTTSNWTSVCARDLAIIWNEIYLYSQKDTEVSRTLDSNFRNALYNYLKVLQPDYDIAHKSGWTEEVFNDAGIVYEHNGNPYIIAILSYDPEGNILCPLALFLDEVMTDYYSTIY